MAGQKLFVGSLPHGIQDSTLRTEFGKFGQVEDVFVKPGCETTKQWAFVTYTLPEEAQRAKDATDRILQFPGTDRPCDVMVAKNQGMFGQDPINSNSGGNAYPMHTYGATYAAPVSTIDHSSQPKKIFVGSLPESITDNELRSEFSKYGQIVDVFLNNKPVEPGRQWAFLSFASAEQAQCAKVNADRALVFPGSDKACEVTLARHQGMFGKDPLGEGGTSAVNAQPAYMPYAASNMYLPTMGQGPRKIFVGSLPHNVTDAMLTSEFSKYGQVVDVHLNNKACEPGRNWAFITFASPEQATYAKDATDRVLMIPGGDRACEVMLAKNQGKFGQDAVTNNPMPMMASGQYIPAQPMVQPPPPPTPPPQHLTPWRMYKTAAGLPYYHNHTTGVTQWECPPDLQVPQHMNAYMAQPVMMAQARYAPY